MTIPRGRNDKRRKTTSSNKNEEDDDDDNDDNDDDDDNDDELWHPVQMNAKKGVIPGKVIGEVEGGKVSAR